ncbi:MAG: SDR family NAD(P)-dependent oxidoreductase [Planctomycetota bacterium]
MDLKLTNQVAVVTGGASGIGAATATMLQQEGCRVVVMDHKIPSDIIYPTEKPMFREVDVACLEQVTRVWAEVESSVGAIEVLVHAAAVGSGYFGFPYTRVPISSWEKVLRVNVLGMANIAHVAGPAMSARRSGAMVFLGSVAGQMGSQTDPPYSASKAANINFAQCLAKDLAPSGVRVNTVCPGMVKTSLNESVWRAWHDQQPPDQRKSYDDWASEKISQVVPLGRWQTADDIAAMIVFLCSSRASEVTGQTINVDGGCVMHW